MCTTAVGATEINRLVELERELEVMRLRLAVTRLVSRDVSMWVGDNGASLDAIVDDVMRRWQARSEDDPETLDGPNGFWVRYATGVEWASTTSDQFRAEFCSPVQGASFDTGDYFHAVWKAHVARLRGASERSGTTA